MKNHFPLFFLMIACLALASCKKDEVNNCDPDGDCFSAKIDGVLFESDNVTGTLVIFDVISIGATSGTNPVPTFGLFLITTAEGTYSFSTPDDVTAEYSPGALTSTTLYGATSGSLTIQEHDTASKRIKGTFNFEGDDGNGGKIQVTEGFFDLGYQ
jgi:uncharacterized protein DUF6252